MSNHHGAYTKGSVFRHLLVLSGTSAVGLFAIFIVDLVDVFFISLLGAPELAAAVGFAGLGLFLGASVSVGISIGVSTLVAKAIGADQDADAGRLATHGLIYSLVWTLPVTIITVIYARELIAMIGAEGQTLDLAVRYFRIVGCTLPLFGMGLVASSLLRSVGDPKRSMWATVLAGVVNAILDPLFIFALSMGLDGAAYASVVSRITILVVAMYGLVKRHKLLSRVEPAKIIADFKALTAITVPSLITNLSGPLSSAYATAQMAKFGTDAVAAASVISRLAPVVFAGLYGLSGSVGPIASQNFGAGQFQRVEQVLWDSAKFCILYVIPVSILTFFLQDWLVVIFNLQGDAAALLRFYATFIVATYLLFGVQLAANPIFTALNHPGLTTISNFVRDLVLAIPSISLFAGTFGAPGVLAGQALANAIAGILAFVAALWLVRKVERGEPIDTSWVKRQLCPHREAAPGVPHRGY